MFINFWYPAGRSTEVTGTPVRRRMLAQDFQTVLGSPEQHLRIVHADMALDSMGVLHEAGGAEGSVVRFFDLIGRDRRCWTVALMYCDQVQGEPTIGDRMLTAQRWLGL